MNLAEEELKHECARVFEEMDLTIEESQYLFRVTSKQSKSLLWYEYRKGRLTASCFGNIVHTSLDNPSKSLIDKIFQRTKTPKSPAIKWGIDNEDTAREAYKQYMAKHHVSFEVKEAGLFVNPNAPHLGASPDGMVFCDCCDCGSLEIKCPYSVRDDTPTLASYFERNGDKYTLSKKHNYYYQIQGQIAILECSYCDFVCWTPHGLNIERIYLDTDFITAMMPKLDKFFVTVILPEVLSGCNQQADQTTGKFCFCQQGESGKMISCDSTDCKFVWFHYSCVNLSTDFEPDEEEEWLCPDCRKKARI